jgi:diacylglycerol kinase family enzyme
MKRLLVIVNPYATTVSDRLKNLVVYALRGSYHVNAVDTERRQHATSISRDAAASGDYDAVVAFGGDGTVNEAANGLVGTGLPLICLPGGRVNVYCRMLGIPADVVDATEHVLGLAEDWQPRLVDLGRIGERYFVVNAGVGLDAAVVEQVDSHPRLKTRFGEYYYVIAATTIFTRRYLISAPRLQAQFGDGSEVDGVTMLVQNGSPYSYFGDRPIEVIDGPALNSGDLSGVVLKRTSPLELPTITWRMLSSRAQVADHRQVEGFREQTSMRVRSLDERPLPIQVDGDYIGTTLETEIGISPAALTVVA